MVQEKQEGATIIFDMPRNMKGKGKNILITGPPGIGKTTLVKKVYHGLKTYEPEGFYTDEIREKGVRKGFALVGFNGKRNSLAHVNLKSPHRVGKYGVDVICFEKFLDEVNLFNATSKVLIIDEIGKMECFSEKFSETVRKLFDNEDRVVVATIAAKGKGLISELKGRPDVKLFEINRENRNTMSSHIVGEVLDVLP